MHVGHALHATVPRHPLDCRVMHVRATALARPCATCQFAPSEPTVSDGACMARSDTVLALALQCQVVQVPAFTALPATPGRAHGPRSPGAAFPTCSWRSPGEPMDPVLQVPPFPRAAGDPRESPWTPFSRCRLSHVQLAIPGRAHGPRSPGAAFPTCSWRSPREPMDPVLQVPPFPRAAGDPRESPRTPFSRCRLSHVQLATPGRAHGPHSPGAAFPTRRPPPPRPRRPPPPQRHRHRPPQRHPIRPPSHNWHELVCVR